MTEAEVVQHYGQRSFDRNAVSILGLVAFIVMR